MSDEVTLGLVGRVAGVEHGDGATDGHFAVIDNFDDLMIFQNRFDLPNATLHMALVVFGRVIVAVFLQVTHLAGTADSCSHFDAATCREVEVLGLQAFEGNTREAMRRHIVRLSSEVRQPCVHGDVRSLDRVNRAAGRRSHRIAVIGGDGIGPEVTAEALKVVRASGVELDTTFFDLGGARYLRDGEVLSDETLAALRGFDAILLGAVGTPGVPPGVIERGLLLKLRFSLDLYINQRPFIGTAPGHTTPHDFVVIRENTEGPYVGEGGVLRKGSAHEVATQGSVNTRFGVERCIRYAFELAAARERKHVTLVHKTNVLTFAGDLWQRTFDAVATQFPAVGTAYNHVDAACIYFVQDPQRYDVIVTDNLFGDILTDLGGAVSGGIGLASSANLNPARTGPSLFEPVHGSAPDIAGKGVANPVAAILSAALMLDHLGESAPADAIRAACVAPTSGSTIAVGDEICRRLHG